MASRIAKAIKDDPRQELACQLVKAGLIKLTKVDTDLIIHYTHEKRLQNHKKDIHQLWHQTFAQTPVLKTRLITHKRTSHNMVRELVDRYPWSSQPINNNQSQPNTIPPNNSTEHV